jgi:phosphatidylglycerophosphatase A
MASTPQPEHKRTLWGWATGTFFGIGLVGKGGGTVASIATVLLWWAAAKYSPTTSLLWGTVIAAALATAIGIPAGSIVARECGKKDPSEVVIDEVAGQLIALIGAAVTWKYVLASLILFRGFDIFKPLPVRQLESLPAGWGIMLDDVAAGLYALAILRLLQHFVPYAL